MATLARRLRQRLGVTCMFMLSGLGGTLCGSVCGAPALASDIPFLPPQVVFISNGKYEGTLQTPGMTLPITGTLAYLTGDIEYLKISVDTEQITSDSWVVTSAPTVIPTAINEWEIVSTDPTTCGNEVLSGDSYPQCPAAWTRTPKGLYILECTVTLQGNKATLDISAQLSNDNKLVQLQETVSANEHTPIIKDSLTIKMTEQGTTPPVPSDFDRPSICNAPSQGNEVGLCTGTFPSICL